MGHNYDLEAQTNSNTTIQAVEDKCENLMAATGATKEQCMLALDAATGNINYAF